MNKLIYLILMASFVLGTSKYSKAQSKLYSNEFSVE